MLEHGWLHLYRGRRVLVTGHTGIKGSWLCAWLTRLGAEVTGLALVPETQPNLFTAAGLDRDMRSLSGDVRNPEAVSDGFAVARPDVVFHLAAQSLVRRSYRDPVGTYATNVMGTVHVLEAARRCDDVQAVVVVTSDKCYENLERDEPYGEGDAMGGHDPYSSSKGCAELVTSALRRSFFGEPGSACVASARAGNVIGGGDWSEDRLVPDLVRAAASRSEVVLRRPHAVRPWQHVLEPLRGYLMLGAALITRGSDYATGWNFGPDEQDAITVRRLAAKVAAGFGGIEIVEDDAGGPHEAERLRLDSTKAAARLGWKPVLSCDEAVDLTVSWYRDYYAAPAAARRLTEQQIRDYAARFVPPVKPVPTSLPLPDREPLNAEA